MAAPMKHVQKTLPRILFSGTGLLRTLLRPVQDLGRSSLGRYHSVDSGSSSDSDTEHQVTSVKDLPKPPNRPLTSYFAFLQDVRPKLKQEFPGLKSAELMKYAGQSWEQLDKVTKKEYIDAAAERMKAYSEAYEEWKNSLTAEQEFLIKEEKEKKKKAKTIWVEYKKKPGAPTGPRNAYIIYMSTRMAGNSKLPKEKKMTRKQVTEDWKALSEDHKHVYKELAEFDKIRYEEEMNEFIAASKREE